MPSFLSEDGKASSALTIHQVFATGQAAVIGVGKGDPGTNVAKSSGMNGGNPAMLKDFKILQK